MLFSNMPTLITHSLVCLISNSVAYVPQYATQRNGCVSLGMGCPRYRNATLRCRCVRGVACLPYVHENVVRDRGCLSLLLARAPLVVVLLFLPHGGLKIQDYCNKQATRGLVR